MSDGKSFWSTVPGVVTGAASIVTAIVGLLGISLQAGWIGGDDGGSSVSSSDGVTTSVASTLPGATTLPRSAVTATEGEFAVEPPSVTFEPLKAKDATVSVENTGDVPLTMRTPTVSGSDAASFKATDVSCARSTLAPGRSCEVKVTFAAPGPGDYAAKLVVAASNAPRQVEVDLKGSATLLG